MQDLDFDFDVGFDISMTKDDLRLSTLTPSSSSTSLYQLQEHTQSLRRSFAYSTTTVTTTTTTTTTMTNAPAPSPPTLPSSANTNAGTAPKAGTPESCTNQQERLQGDEDRVFPLLQGLGLVSEGPYLFILDTTLSLYFPIRALILFVLGFVFSLVIDHLQTQHHLVEYPSNAHQFLDTASWLPPTCGASAVLIGTIYPLGDYIWWGRRVVRNSRDWSSVMRCFGGFIGVNYAASKLPWTSNVQVSCTLALISLGLWFWFDRTAHGFMISFTVAAMGTLVAYFLVLNGWYSYEYLDDARVDLAIDSRHQHKQKDSYTTLGQASVAMTTIMANNAQDIGQVDADELFIKLSVPELNVYERRTRQDIENKKQELRMMVGERYRDLIGAADCIVRMKETTLAVQGNIARMRNSCDIHSLKRTVAAKTKNAHSGAMDEMKKSLYTSAAQIKLLADVPEQIWRNMEHSNYLTASRLFLISKAIHNNLNSENEDESGQTVKIMETFPVVGRQWDAVSHFKAQILQKGHLHLKDAKGTDLDVIETICAIMLLDDVTIKDMFRLLLVQRQTAIQEVLESPGKDIGAQVVEAINILKATLFHINGVFLEAEQSRMSPLERHLRSLQQTFSTPVANTTTSSSTRGDALSPLQPSALPNLATSIIPKLYPTTPNIHLLVRYLPESVQNYTPFIHLEGIRAAFTQQEVLQGVRTWMKGVNTMFGSCFKTLLQQIDSGADLAAIRSKAWVALQTDEYALVSKKKNHWNEVCQVLLGEHFSIWDSILRSQFAEAFRSVIVASLEVLSQQPERLLRPRLGELDNEDDPNHNIGKFIWNDSGVTKGAGSLPSATEPLIQRIQEYVAGKTDIVVQATDAFEQGLGAIRLDQEQALAFELETAFGALLEEGEDEDLDRHGKLDLFTAKADTKELIEFYQRRCVEFITTYISGLEQLAKEAVRKPEKARNTVPAMSRAMTVGRVASSIASMGWMLYKALAPPRESSSTSNFAQARAAKANVEAQVQGLITGLQRVYLISHEAWIESVEWTLTRGLKHYLKDSSWTDLATLAWEPLTMATSTKGSTMSSSARVVVSEATDDAKTLLPFHGSTRLLGALHQVVQDMHRVGTGFMRPELVKILTLKLGLATFRVLDQFLKDAQDADADVTLSEKGAMQLLFDVKFLYWVFHSSMDNDSSLSQLAGSVLDQIKTYIDPINLAVFEKPLDINAERQYGRVAVLLGLLVQLNPIDRSRKHI
ncbi:Golgi transport complex subunit 1 [Haplosporangium sp. Z 767]|nr:Golgi transport complex subunit 1 [Haplosporangium sp. Z 767]